MPLEDWSRYREILAGGIPANDFARIDSAFSQLRLFDYWRGRGEAFEKYREVVERAAEEFGFGGIGRRIVRAGHSRREFKAYLRELGIES
jgi:hypothetical protein